MAFEHTETTWAEWLKTVQAGRPPNVKVTGQPIEDLLRGTIAIANAEHLADPLNYVQGGYMIDQGAVVAQYSRLEVIATVPMWITWLQISADVYLEGLDAPNLGGHAAPPTIFSGAPRNLVIGGTSADVPAANALFMSRGTALEVWQNPPIYIPRGRVFSMCHDSVNIAIQMSVFWREIPQTR